MVALNGVDNNRFPGRSLCTAARHATRLMAMGAFRSEVVAVDIFGWHGEKCSSRCPVQPSKLPQL